MSVPHFRGVDDFRNHGIVLDTESNEAAKMFDALNYQIYSLTELQDFGGINGTYEKLVAADENFSFAKLIQLSALEQNLKIRFDPNGPTKQLCDSLALKSKSLASSPKYFWTRLHINAGLSSFFGYRELALNNYLDCVASWPADLYAGTKIIFHAIHFAQPHVTNLAFSTFANSLSSPYRDKSNIYYSHIQSRYAFGLCESGRYNDKAEKILNSCLEIDPTNNWAHHSLAHVAISNAQLESGFKQMESSECLWTSNPVQNLLMCHNYWHQATFAWHLGFFDRVLDILDSKIIPRACLKGSDGSTSDFNMSDAVSLMIKLSMEGVVEKRELENRWNFIYENIIESKLENLSGFNFYNTHISLALLAANRPEKCDKILDLLQESLKKCLELLHSVEELNCDQTTTSVKLGKRPELFNDFDVNRLLSTGFKLYCEKEYEDAANVLFENRNEIFSIGGSIAQQELYFCILLFCLSKCQSELNLNRLKMLLLELKSKNRLNNFAFGRLLTSLPVSVNHFDL